MRAALALLALAPAWVLLSSAAFAVLTGRLLALGLSALWCWPLFAWHGLREGFWPGDSMALMMSGAAAGALGALLAALAKLPNKRLKPTVRSGTDTYGHADWATVDQCRARFPGSNPVHGCLVVGELRRRDLEGLRGVMYDPDPKTGRGTWGMGGRAELLADPAYIRSTHSLWFIGSGGGKSQTILCTLAHPTYRWLASVVVGDPKGELERDSRRVRKALGHRILALRPGGRDAINIFASINPRSKTFESDVQAITARIFSDEGAKRVGHNEGDWIKWAKTAVNALAVHMLSDPDWPPGERTPRKLREVLALDEHALRQVLIAVGADSHNLFARQQATSLLVDAKDTWGGIHVNIQAGTNWLSTGVYADLVSGHQFDPAEICRGNVTAYIQIPPKVARETPAVLRCLYGAFADAAYEANGNIAGRILFDIDEAYQVGRLGIIETIRDLGRSYRITLRLWYQSVGQLEEVWGRDGKKTWYSCTAYRVYAGVADEDTAKEVSALAGHYTIRAESDGRSSNASGGMLVAGQVSRGTSTNANDVRHPLASIDEILHEWGDDEAFVFSRGMSSMLVGLPMAYRRPEMQIAPVSIEVNAKKPIAAPSAVV